MTSQEEDPTANVESLQAEIEHLRAKVGDLESRLLLAEEVPDLIYVFDAVRGRIQYVNRRGAVELGYHDADLDGSSPDMERFVHPDDLRIFGELVERFKAATDATVLESDFRLRDRRGSYRWFRSRCRVRRGSDGQCLGLIGTARDATEWRNIEAHLVRLASAVEQTEQPMLITNPQGVIQHINPAFERLSGFSAQEVIGRTPRMLKSGTHDRRFYDDLWRVLGQGQVWTGRITNRRKDGSLYEDEVSIAPLKSADGQVTGYVSTNHNVTRQTSKQRGRRMVAVSQLAGGVAHDLNNLIQVAQGYTALAIGEVADQPQVHADLEQVLAVIRKIRKLLHQLLALSASAPAAVREVHLADVLKGAAASLRELLGPEITLDFVLKPAASVRADPDQLLDLLHHLCQNAHEAAPQGKVTIGLGKLKPDRTVLDRHPEAAEVEHVVLSVTDHGPQIPSAVLEDIFEPFRTEWHLRQRRGLALAAAYGIAQQQGGFIECESTPRETSFRVYLPVACSSSPTHTAPPPLGTRSSNQATILLADDEAQVRSLVQRVLERAGHRVIVASDGDEAVQCFAAHAQEIDLAVLDVAMPRLSGPQVLRKLREAAPHVPALFITGQSFGLLDQDLHVPILTKPFSPQHLLQQVEALLNYPIAATA